MASRKAKSEARQSPGGKMARRVQEKAPGKYYLLRFLLQEAKGELLRISRGSSTSTGSSSVQCIDQD